METNMNCLPVRRCSIECIDHPEWGSFGVYEDRDLWYEIGNEHGRRILSKDEAIKFWKVKS